MYTYDFFNNQPVRTFWTLLYCIGKYHKRFEFDDTILTFKWICFGRTQSKYKKASLLKY